MTTPAPPQQPPDERRDFWLGCLTAAGLLFGGMLVGAIFSAVTGPRAGFEAFALPAGLILTIVVIPVWRVVVGLPWLAWNVVRKRSFLGGLAASGELSPAQRILALLPALLVSPLVAGLAGVLSWMFSGGQRSFTVTAGGFAILGAVQGAVVFFAAEAGLLEHSFNDADVG
jgi:hypothetical protein